MFSICLYVCRGSFKIGGNVINSVNTYKILGVIMHNDLKWNSHVDYITKKACKKLYSLRVLRRARVSQSNMLRIYLGSVRPVLEYAVPVWQDIPVYLSEAIGNCRNVRGLGKSMVVFRLFEKLRYSNER